MSIQQQPLNELSFELVGTPRIEAEYSDQYETVMVCDLKRSDGETGDVWIVAGVPACHVGSANACGSQVGFLNVRVFGDSVDMWCPESLRVAAEDGRYDTVRESVVEAVRKVAIQTHNEACESAPAVSPFDASFDSDEDDRETGV